jgi:plasmid stabilization system protein ParE
MPEPRLEIHPDVQNDDLVEIISYIASDNPVAADCVYKAITELFANLARHPLMGTAYSPLRLALTGIRMCVVTEYPNYLVYYRPLPGNAGVRILYVLHAARDAATFAKAYRRQ